MGQPVSASIARQQKRRDENIIEAKPSEGWKTRLETIKRQNGSKKGGLRQSPATIAIGWQAKRGEIYFIQSKNISKIE